MEALDPIQGALSNLYNTVSVFLPKLIGAIVLLIIFWIVAKMIKWAIEKVLRGVKFDNLADNVGINGFLAKGGMKSKASGMLAKLVYWIIMLIGLGMFFNSLGLEVVSNLLTDVVAYIPNIIVGCILLIVGMYLAKFVSGIARTALQGAGFSHSELVTNIVYGAIMFLTVTLTLNQIGIGGEILNTIVNALFSSLGFAFAGFLAIAFGLGGKEWAANILNKYTK